MLRICSTRISINRLTERAVLVQSSDKKLNSGRFICHSLSFKYKLKSKQSFVHTLSPIFSDSKKFFILPVITKTMDAEYQCDNENESKVETSPKKNSKRDRETDSTSAISPPPKKSQNSQQTLSMGSTRSGYKTSLTSTQTMQDDRSYDDDSAVCEANEASSSNYDNKGLVKDLDSRFSVSVAVDNDPCDNEGTKYFSTDPHSFVTSSEDPCPRNQTHNSTDSLRNQMASSRFKLNENMSEDSLDQAVSLTDSFNQDTSLIESGDFSLDISGTECESLSSSQFLPHDDTGDYGGLEERASISTTTTIHSKINKAVSSASISDSNRRNESTPRRKKKSKHGSKKSTNKSDAAGANLRNLRPNYFVGIQISNADIHKALIQVQEDMVAHDESLIRSMVDVATSHITLLVAHVGTEEALSLASSALANCGKRLKDDLSACPIQLTFSGLNHFGHQVVYAPIVEDDHYHRLMDLAECVRSVFAESQVCMPDTRTLHPHLTVAKLSKAPRIKGKHTPRKIDPSSYRKHVDLHLGCQIVMGLQLLAMNKSKDQNRYYYNSAQVLFDIKSKDSTDHSQCCFPRRPTLSPHLSKSQHRPYSTAATEQSPENVAEEADSEPPEHSWLLPTLLLATAFASAVLFSVIIPRIRNQ